MTEYKEKHYRLLIYKSKWDEVKKEYGLTDRQLQEYVRRELQMHAWSDIFEGVRCQIDDDKQEGILP